MAAYGRDQFSPYQETTTGAEDGVRLAQAIGNNVQKISQNVSKLERLVKQIGTQQDSEQVREQVHQTTHYTNQLAKETNKDMQRLAHLPLPPGASTQRQMKMQRERLTEEFSNTLKNFQTIQRTATEKERASLSRARAASGSTFPTVQIKSPYVDEPQPEEQFSQEGFSKTAQVLQMENDVDLQLIHERESAIKQLESDIMDVNQIFKDLGMLVHEQGETLDSIEANVESTNMHVQEGTKQLGQAMNYQSKARRKKCCLIMLLLIIVVIVGIIIAVSVTSKNN